MLKSKNLILHSVLKSILDRNRALFRTRTVSPSRNHFFAVVSEDWAEKPRFIAVFGPDRTKFFAGATLRVAERVRRQKIHRFHPRDARVAFELTPIRTFENQSDTFAIVRKIKMSHQPLEKVPSRRAQTR